MLAYRMTLEIKKRKQVKAEVRIKRWKLKTVAQSSGDRLWMPGKRKDRRNSEEHRQGGFWCILWREERGQSDTRGSTGKHSKEESQRDEDRSAGRLGVLQRQKRLLLKCV